MKLVQKKRPFETFVYELFDDCLTITQKRFLKKKRTTIYLNSLNPEPETLNTESLISFNSLDKNDKLLALQFDQPDSSSFDSFVNAIIENIIKLNSQGDTGESVITAYSQRMMTPYSGLVQIAESKQARALTMDGKNWEFQYIHIMLSNEGQPGKHYRRRYSHALTVDRDGLEAIIKRAENNDIELDRSLIELAVYLSNASFPFPSKDCYEYWLLDKQDNSPLALIFSCADAEQMSTFPVKNEWTALPAAVMPVELNDDEKANQQRPVNIRVEQMVNERAGGLNAKAKWFKRHADETDEFPPLLLSEKWSDEAQADLCHRYLSRQSPRLLLLQNLLEEDRRRLEIQAKNHALEVERFHRFYPQVIDQNMINAALVEARLRKNTVRHSHSNVENRRDGVLYL
jgi:hypothetical protein